MNATLLQARGESASTRAAQAVLDKHAPALLVAAKRAVPFLVRRGAALSAAPAAATTLDAAVASLGRPSFALQLSCRNGAPAALGLDAVALGMLIDGVLGGGGSPIALASLTPAQGALAQRVAESIASSLSDVLQQRLGFAVVPARGASAGDGACVSLGIDLALGDHTGRALLALAPSALAQGPTRVSFDAPPLDPAVARAVDAVEVDVAVELGRIPMRLSRLAALRVGDTLVADVPVGRPVTVLVEGEPLFSGHPTAIEGQFAVRLQKRA